MSRIINVKDIKNNKYYVIGCIIFVVFILFVASFRTINSGEVGIKVRFGKVIDTHMNEGVNFKIPLIENIVKMNVRVQKIEVDTNSASKDLQDVNMKLAVNYKIDKKEAVSLYKTVGSNYERIVLEPAIQESIKAITSKYTAEQLITTRSEVSDKCMKELSEKVEKYGLSISDFNITDFNFSEEFNKAIEEKQVAEQKVLTAKQELEKEKIEAEKKIVAAEAEKRANDMKRQSLTDNIVREKFIEKWNGELPKVTGSGNIFDISSILGDK